jgi:hypothetical protein
MQQMRRENVAFEAVQADCTDSFTDAADVLQTAALAIMEMCADARKTYGEKMPENWIENHVITITEAKTVTKAGENAVFTEKSMNAARYIFRAVRAEIEASRAVQAGGKYTYIEDYANDENDAESALFRYYRRVSAAHIAADENGTDAQTYADIEAIAAAIENELTARQRQAFTLMRRACGQKEIARRLKISQNAAVCLIEAVRKTARAVILELCTEAQAAQIEAARAEAEAAAQADADRAETEAETEARAQAARTAAEAAAIRRQAKAAQAAGAETAHRAHIAAHMVEVFRAKLAKAQTQTADRAQNAAHAAAVKAAKAAGSSAEAQAAAAAEAAAKAAAKAFADCTEADRTEAQTAARRAYRSAFLADAFTADAEAAGAAKAQAAAVKIAAGAAARAAIEAYRAAARQRSSAARSSTAKAYAAAAQHRAKARAAIAQAAPQRRTAAEAQADAEAAAIAAAAMQAARAAIAAAQAQAAAQHRAAGIEAKNAEARRIIAEYAAAGIAIPD